MAAPDWTHSRSWLAVAITIASTGLAGSCRVDIPGDALFPCQNDADCGDDGARCLWQRDGGGICCVPSPEVCDGRDNDCNDYVDDALDPVPCYEGPAGTADVGVCRSGVRVCTGGQLGPCTGQALPQGETCNDLDDDCDRDVDEGLVDANGECIPTAETDCANTVDEDQDALTDCADPDCLARSCRAAPSAFTCDAASACTCGGVPNPPPESNCIGGGDEDCDGLVDCADPDCANQLCRAAPATFRCATGGVCSCNGSANPAPESACSDGQDSDCDGVADCNDRDCCGIGACTACQTNETTCNDNYDNDFDGLKDCADPTCDGRSCGGGGRKCTNLQCPP